MPKPKHRGALRRRWQTQPRRKQRYVVLMTVCLLLFALAAPVGALAGADWGIVMCVVAAAIPPVAVILGNIADPRDPKNHDARYGPNAPR
ncbi:MAG: DUF3099 domain-containing protein [Thermobifida fusca]|uniref:DUF3099 domain-containing protein n=1 Tax=Thermobifida TaxID=83677 RepID=UPI0021585E3A|nr:MULTISPECIES: DUF3099 domain-containing protein [Thermobifida]MDD6793197.1 DUF3099 domain-containing protein [Thermobifida fusca]